VERINFDFKVLRELPIVKLLQTLWHKVMTVRYQRYQLLIMHNIHHTAYQSSTHTELRLANIKFKPLRLYYILTIYSLLSFYHNFIQFKPDKIPTLQIFILLYSVRMYHHQNLIPIQRKNLHAMPLALTYLGGDKKRYRRGEARLHAPRAQEHIYSTCSQPGHNSRTCRTPHD